MYTLILGVPSFPPLPYKLPLSFFLSFFLSSFLSFFQSINPLSPLLLSFPFPPSPPLPSPPLPSPPLPFPPLPSPSLLSPPLPSPSLPSHFFIRYWLTWRCLQTTCPRSREATLSHTPCTTVVLPLRTLRCPNHHTHLHREG